ncbi:phosphoinositide-3-kinase, regulatory subunit 4 [Branchiostoma belcheri]|nr:phosphoinositide-3-kinase, regulatory subunit 4 [Branchiostoma belcheri]
MGAQLTSIAPSQILSVDNYLTDVTDYEYDCSLGSTRFFKVARAKYKEGLAVVKVFPIYDPTLPLKQYKEELEDIKSKLEPASNCLPFQRVTETNPGPSDSSINNPTNHRPTLYTCVTQLSEKAALLFRQYVRGNLYDRISTRPFLNSVEKRWIAFQLLCALNQAHKLKVCHGDIKTENVMVTGWNWVLLTDFASFKPTYLPEDHPADFSYFFDTSRRRVCYIAPERFVDVRQEEEMKKGDKMQTLLETSLAEEGLITVRLGDLTAAMDIFSVGNDARRSVMPTGRPRQPTPISVELRRKYNPPPVGGVLSAPTGKVHLQLKNKEGRGSAEDSFPEPGPREGNLSFL